MLRARKDVHRFFYMSVIAAGCLHSPDMQIFFYMLNNKLLWWVCVEARVNCPLGMLRQKETKCMNYFVGSQPASRRGCLEYMKRAQR